MYWFIEYILSFLEIGPLKEPFCWWGICWTLGLMNLTVHETAMTWGHDRRKFAHQLLKWYVINGTLSNRAWNSSNENHNCNRHLNLTHKVKSSLDQIMPPQDIDVLSSEIQDGEDVDELRRPVLNTYRGPRHRQDRFQVPYEKIHDRFDHK